MLPTQASPRLAGQPPTNRRGPVRRCSYGIGARNSVKDISDFVEDYPCRRIQRRIRIAAAIALADGSEWDVVGRIIAPRPPLTREPIRSRNRGSRRLPLSASTAAATLSPRKGDFPPDPKRLVRELDDLVRRMLAAAPVERDVDIREYWRRLKRAFEGPATPREQTQSGRATIKQRQERDDLAIAEVVLDLAAAHYAKGGLRAHGAAGEVHDALMQAWLKGNRAGRPPWGKTNRSRNARVKAIRQKLEGARQAAHGRIPGGACQGSESRKMMALIVVRQ